MFASACGSMGRGNCRCGEMVLPGHRPNASAPKIAGHAKQVSQFLQTERFDHISVGAEAISLIGIRFVSSGTEQDNRHLRRFGVASHPAKELEAVHLRHLDVADDEVWERMRSAFVIFAFMTQIAHGFETVLDNVKRGMGVGASQCCFEQERVLG